MSLPLYRVRAEFARRAVQFHGGEKLGDIKLWGLFSWGAISKHVKSGRVILENGFTKENRTVWCRPSKEEIDKYILPLIESKSLELLTIEAGWGSN
jgi:hypothetical protein